MFNYLGIVTIPRHNRQIRARVFDHVGNRYSIRSFVLLVLSIQDYSAQEKKEMAKNFLFYNIRTLVGAVRTTSFLLPADLHP